MTLNSGKWILQHKGVECREHEQYDKDHRCPEKIPDKNSTLVELAASAQNWLMADSRKLKISCKDYEAEICEQLKMLKRRDLALVQETFRLSLRGKD